MIAKGELVLAPVQQQDLAFLMQSGTQEWRGEYQAAQMTSLMQLEQELAQGKLFCKNFWTLVVFLEEQPVGVGGRSLCTGRSGASGDSAGRFLPRQGIGQRRFADGAGLPAGNEPVVRLEAESDVETLRHRRCLSAADSTQRVYWDATAFIMDATMTAICTAI